MFDLDSLKVLLEQGELTCAIARGEKLYTSNLRGIRPLLELIGRGEDFSGGSAADKIVGRAAALLYAHMGIRELYAAVLGEGGLEVLRAHGIAVRFGTLTGRIIDRAGTDICPMERACEGIDDPAEAYIVLKRRADELAADRSAAAPAERK